MNHNAAELLNDIDKTIELLNIRGINECRLRCIKKQIKEHLNDISTIVKIERTKKCIR